MPVLRKYMQDKEKFFFFSHMIFDFAYTMQHDKEEQMDGYYDKLSVFGVVWRQIWLQIPKMRDIFLFLCFHDKNPVLFGLTPREEE